MAHVLLTDACSRRTDKTILCVFALRPGRPYFFLDEKVAKNQGCIAFPWKLRLRMGVAIRAAFSVNLIGMFQTYARGSLHLEDRWHWSKLSSALFSYGNAMRPYEQFEFDPSAAPSAIIALLYAVCSCSCIEKQLSPLSTDSLFTDHWPTDHWKSRIPHHSISIQPDKLVEQ